MYKINSYRFKRCLIILFILSLSITVVVGREGIINEVDEDKEDIVKEIIIYKEEIVEKEEIKSQIAMTKLGEFTVTGYTKEDREGKEIMMDYEGVNVIANKETIPYGTKVWIEGVGIRQVQPSNQDIGLNEIKVYFKDEKEKTTYGVQEIEVYKIEE